MVKNSSVLKGGNLLGLPKTLILWFKKRRTNHGDQVAKSDGARVARILSIFLFFSVVLSYYIFSRQYNGPAYLSDEIGYLTKAATAAGYFKDAANSWHAGYSLLISPLFRIFSDPNATWQAVMVVNALMWGASLCLLFNMLRRMFPLKSIWILFFVTIFTSLYPAWITMSGYAFSTPAFVLVFMLALTVLQRSGLYNSKHLLLYSALASLLYWVHPTGLVVVIASTIFFIIKGVRERNVTSQIKYILVLLAGFSLYRFVVHPWFLSAMTPDGFNPYTHYNDTAGYLRAMKEGAFWKEWGLIILGQFSYILISSFGLVGYSVIEYFRRFSLKEFIKVRSFLEPITKNSSSAVIFIAVLSLVGVVMMGSMAFASSPQVPNRVDIWIYGRYAEVVVLPLIATGLLIKWRLSYAYLSVFIVVCTGVIFSVFVNESNTVMSDNNLVNLQSFWPYALHESVDFLRWFMYGALGISVVGLSWLIKQKFLVVLVIPFFFMSVHTQSSWHSNILDTYSKPSGLYELVDSNFSTEDCIGFSYYDTDKYSRGAKNERIRLYSYYFYEYEFSRMTPDYWFDSCSGPYLTYDTTEFNHLGSEVQAVAREINSGLYVLVKASQVEDLLLEHISKDNIYINLEDEECVIKGCLTADAASLISFSSTGEYRDGSFYTNGSPGYLFYGPYASLKSGNYKIAFKGRFRNVNESAKLEVYSIKEDEVKSFLNTPLRRDVYEYNFTLSEDVEYLEIRLSVDEATDLRFDSYSLVIDK